jgi:uncharacterized membrane protein
MFMILVLVGSFSVKQEALSYGNDDYSGAGGAVYGTCNHPFYSCSQFEGAINYSLRIFFVLMLWMISPVGIIFFWSTGGLISKNTSKLKRSISWIGQILALFIWASFMTILLLLYLDSVTINAFGLGGMFLDTEIASGMVFFVVMFIFALYEKSIEYSADRAGAGAKRKKNEAEEDRGGKGRESIKIAGIEFTGLKDKVRRKVKDGLKEIIDDEIERRL